MVKKHYFYCCVDGCSMSTNEDNVSFFKLPKDTERCNEWLKVIRRPDLLNKPDFKHGSYRVCSRHFENSMMSVVIQRKLIPTATPTIYTTESQPQPSKLVFNEPGRSKSTGTAEQQPSTSASADLQYQPSRYSMVCAQETSQLEEIIIKEEISDEDKNQCRLCLSVGRRMQELAEYAPLYLKLLFENNYQNTTVPSYAYQMLACWECVAELRRIRRFQDKVRRANTAFETSQNQKCENLSNLSTIIIGESNNANAGDGERRQSDMEACVQSIKEEAIEAEVEETYVPDPLEVGHEPGRKEAQHYNIEIEREADVSAPTTKQAAKRAQPEPKTARNAAKRTKTDKNDPKTSQAEEDNDPKPVEGAETDCDAIFAKVKIEIDELEKILAERRNKESFKSMKFKCEPCVLGFTDHNRLLEHHRNFHDEEVGSCECDICERRFTDERQLAAHQRNHFVKFVCRLCQFECYTKTGRAIHYKRHKGALQGASLESILRQRLTSEQRASASGSSREPST